MTGLSTDVTKRSEGFMLSALFVPVVISYLILALLGRLAPQGMNFQKLQNFCAGLGLILVIWLLASASVYLFLPSYLDHAEATVASTAAYWLRGHPIYHAVDGADRYSLLYGPLPFVWNAVFQSLIPDVLVASKISGVLNLLVGSGLLLLTLRRSIKGQTGILMALGLIAGSYLYFDDFSFWNRPESFLLLFVSAALAGSLLLSPKSLSSALLFGLCGAGCFISRINSPLYLIPPLVFFFEHHRISFPNVKWIATFITAGVIGSAVLFLLPGVSVVQNWEYLRLSLTHRFMITNFVGCLSYLLPFLFLLVFSDARKSFPKTFWIFVASSLIMCVSASKEGSGSYHLLPFIPFFVYLSFLTALNSAQKDRTILIAASILIGMTTTLPKIQGSLYRELKNRAHLMAVQADLNEIQRGISGPFAMGYSDLENYKQTFLHPIVVSQGARNFLDAAPLMDLVIGNVGFPPSTWKALESCEIPTFILPKAGQPWTMRSHYTDLGLFPEAWRMTFAQKYQLQRSSTFFSVYVCREPESLH